MSWRGTLLLAIIAWHCGYVCCESLSAADSETQLESEPASGLSSEKQAEIVFDATMEVLGRVAEAHKLVGNILSELPPETNGPFIEQVLEKLSTLHRLGEPAQKVIEAHRIVERLQAREGYRAEPWGILSGTKTELQSRVEKLAETHADRDWERFLQPRNIRPQDIELAQVSWSSPLRESVADLFGEWKRRESSLQIYTERRRIVRSYRNELNKIEARLSKIPATNEFILLEQLDLVDVVLPSLNSADESWERLYREEELQIEEIQHEYSLRSKIIEVLDLKTTLERKRAEFDLHIDNYKAKERHLQLRLTSAIAQTDGIRARISYENQARANFESLSNRPYTACPRGNPFDTCTHGPQKAAYLKDKQDNLDRAQQSAARAAALRPRLDSAESSIRQLQTESAIVAEQRAGSESARDAEVHRYTGEITRIVTDARYEHALGVEELRRQERALRLKQLQRSDPEELILQEMRSRVLRRLVEYISTNSDAAKAANPFAPASPGGGDASFPFAAPNVQSPFSQSPNVQSPFSPMPPRRLPPQGFHRR